MSPVEIAEVHVHVRTLILPVEEDAAAAHSPVSSTGFTPPAARPRRYSGFAKWENQDNDTNQMSMKWLCAIQRSMPWMTTGTY